jgi:hypothetical protein
VPGPKGPKPPKPLVRTWRDEPREPGPCVLVDIDGVIADGNHRQRFMRATPRDYRGFFEAAVRDTPILEAAILLRIIDADVAIVLVSGRPARIHDLTVAWLREHGFRWDLLVLRADGDLRSASDAKADAVRELRSEGWLPVLALDDEPGNVAMYQGLGIPALYIHSGYYE